MLKIIKNVAAQVAANSIVVACDQVVRSYINQKVRARFEKNQENKRVR